MTCNWGPVSPNVAPLLYLLCKMDALQSSTLLFEFILSNSNGIMASADMISGWADYDDWWVMIAWLDVTYLLSYKLYSVTSQLRFWWSCIKYYSAIAFLSHHNVYISLVFCDKFPAMLRSLWDPFYFPQHSDNIRCHKCLKWDPCQQIDLRWFHFSS